MTSVTKRRPNSRWQRTLRGPKTLDEDLGGIGEHVGPRTGSAKRTHGQKEDYVLRRLIVALREAGRIGFPATVSAEAERDGEPDFIIVLPNVERLGVEVTEAGNEDYQAWLTRTELESHTGELVTTSDDGIADRFEIGNVAIEIANAIRNKRKAYERGKYRSTDACDLAVYDNTAWGGFLDKREIVHRLRQMNDLRGGFRAVHIVTESVVAIDVLATDFRLIPIGRFYETDLVGWSGEQAARLRHADLDRIDAENIAEEIESLGNSDRRALRSHLQVLLLHLLKWHYQAPRRTRSWQGSLDEARDNIQELLDESPSLRGVLVDSLPAIYPKARRAAARETRLDVSAFPDSCPYELGELLDPGFFPSLPDRLRN